MSEPNDLICPMQFAASHADAGSNSDRLCYREKCAWWMPKQSMHWQPRSSPPYGEGCGAVYDAILTRAGKSR